MEKRKKRRSPRVPKKFGILISRIPAVKPLYPLYLARQLFLDERTLSLPRLPEGLDGLRIAYASDVHYGKYLDRKRLCALADALNALEADLMILGGDYGEDAECTLAFWRDIPDLQAKLGVCGVIGNHDLRGANAAQISQAMRRRGVTPLVNGLITLKHGGCRFAVCATDDAAMGCPDYSRVAKRAAQEPFVIYAPHSPDALAEAYTVADRPFFDLALCGHTHGGQIAVFGVAPRVSSLLGWRYGNRYRSGVLCERGVTVFVSNGVGTSWLPVRLGAKPQYHLITLKRPEKNA